MEFDLHIHTRLYSGCSTIDPESLLRRAVEIGLNGIALTEHGIRWPDEELANLRERCKKEAGKLVVIPGEESACYSKKGEFQGEFLVFGYPRSLGSARSVEELVEVVHGAGGVVIAAHPFKPARTGDDYYGCGEAVAELGVDGLETSHPSYDATGLDKAESISRLHNLAGIGGSDAHLIEEVGRVRTVFEKPVMDTADLCREIRAGQVRVRRAW